MYRRFLQAHGETIDTTEPIETQIAAHITEGEFIGQGSPYITYPFDLEPLPDTDVAVLSSRFRWICEALASWVGERGDDISGDKPVEGGRAERAILLHVIGAQGNYLSAALAGAKGFSALHAAAERGEIPLDVALMRLPDMSDARIAETTFAERQAVRILTSRTYTLRKAFRRSLEHAWEHLSELSRRPNGPRL